MWILASCEQGLPLLCDIWPIVYCFIGFLQLRSTCMWTAIFWNELLATGKACLGDFGQQ